MVAIAKDLGPPKPISDPDFDEICGISKVPRGAQADLRLRLDTLIKIFATSIENAAQQPSLKRDANGIKRALSYIQKARTEFGTCGPAAQVALGAMAPSIGPMVSARWLRQHFPDNLLVPKPKDPPEPRGDRSRRWRSEQYDIEDFSLNERLGFVGDWPLETTNAILHDVEHGLEAALRSLRFVPGAKGGRKPLTHRRYFLINLAEIWRELGWPVRTGPESKFVAFCEQVLAAIDWPTDGSVSATQQAVKHWRNLTKKTA